MTDLPAGRELDARIAEKFGFPMVRKFHRFLHRFRCGKQGWWCFPSVRDGFVWVCACGWRDDEKVTPQPEPVENWQPSARVATGGRDLADADDADFIPYDISPDGDEFSL